MRERGRERRRKEGREEKRVRGKVSQIGMWEGLSDRVKEFWCIRGVERKRKRRRERERERERERDNVCQTEKKGNKYKKGEEKEKNVA